jgi:hypothetical protein
MKKTILAFAIAGLAAAPLLAQPPRGRVAPLPGAHEVEGELVLYAAPDFSGQSQRVTGQRASFTSPFTIRSLSIRPGDRWQICLNPDFRPPCTTVSRPIADATILGITGQVGSIRLVPDQSAAGN